MDEQSAKVVESFRIFIDEVIEEARRGRQQKHTITDEIREHLGTDPRHLPIVTEEVPSHQLVNVDIAMQLLIAQHGGGGLVGVGGGDQRQHNSLAEMIQHQPEWSPFGVAAPDLMNLPVGPTSQRQVVSFGMHLFRYRDHAAAVLQRGGSDQRRHNGASLEVVAPAGVAADLLADVRQLMLQHSVFRGQVLTLGRSDPHQASLGGVTFLTRPTLRSEDVVLPVGVLARVERHIGGAARHRDRLLRAGQHLKRGLLLYGPPGTGKTHTVRYLVGAMPDTTVILLSGTSLELVSEATDLARSLQPALIVLEDVDLIAEHRDRYDSPQPLLFTVLEAMDGLASDAEIAFVLTTNRADLLEPALAQRPGRVDLAVEVPLPDATARLALFRLYARELRFSAEALASAATRATGTTASFARELMRRAVLTAAERDADPGDADLATALDEMLAESSRITRMLLGGTDDGPPSP